MILRPGLLRNGCEEMGLAPTRDGEAPGESAVAKVPVPVFHSLGAGRASKRRRGGEVGGGPFDAWPSGQPRNGG
jgi:hypothetical protein